MHVCRVCVCACVRVELAPKDAAAFPATKADAFGTAATATSVVPQSPQSLVPLIHDVVDRFWECRRYGEPWDSDTPPDGFFDDCTSGSSVEAAARRTHRHLVFDLVAETIVEAYRSEEDLDAADLTPKLGPRKREPPPTTLDSLKPYVEDRVLGQLRGTAGPAAPPRWSSRRRQDVVDALLVRELAEEEPGWVDYSAAEFDVKTGLVDSLVELLLNDTVQTVQQAMRFRQMGAS